MNDELRKDFCAAAYNRLYTPTTPFLQTQVSLSDSCTDSADWEDSSSYTCQHYKDNSWCNDGVVIDPNYIGFGAEENCCACGKGNPSGCSLRNAPPPLVRLRSLSTAKVVSFTTGVDMSNNKKTCGGLVYNNGYPADGTFVCLCALKKYIEVTSGYCGGATLTSNVTGYEMITNQNDCTAAFRNIRKVTGDPGTREFTDPHPTGCSQYYSMLGIIFLRANTTLA
jgi:hypothetical protein